MMYTEFFHRSYNELEPCTWKILCSCGNPNPYQNLKPFVWWRDWRPLELFFRNPFLLRLLKHTFVFILHFFASNWFLKMNFSSPSIRFIWRLSVSCEDFFSDLIHFLFTFFKAKLFEHLYKSCFFWTVACITSQLFGKLKSYNPIFVIRINFCRLLFRSCEQPFPTKCSIRELNEHGQIDGSKLDRWLTLKVILYTVFQHRNSPQQFMLECFQIFEDSSGNTPSWGKNRADSVIDRYKLVRKGYVHLKFLISDTNK